MEAPLTSRIDMFVLNDQSVLLMLGLPSQAKSLPVTPTVRPQGGSCCMQLRVSSGLMREVSREGPTRPGDAAHVGSPSTDPLSFEE